MTAFASYFSMFPVTVVLTILCLIPPLLYVIGKIKDPFHPLILVGVLSYFVSAHRMFSEHDELLTMLPESAYVNYLFVCILSVLGIYAGWWHAGKRNQGPKALPKPPRLYDPGQLILAAGVCALVGVLSHFAFYEDYDVSGYLLDAKMLWITAAILCVQIFALNPNNRVGPAVIFLVALIPPVDRFLVYGQRGDTFRLAAIAEAVYFNFGRRPSKPLFIGASILLALVLGTLQMTRKIVNDGESPNRFSALAQVIPRFFRQEVVTVDPGEEIIFGAASIETIQTTGRYGYGVGLTAGLVMHLIPRGLVPDKDSILLSHGGFDSIAIKDATGLNISGGAAPSGFANGFFEMGWFCSIPWIFLGYFYRRLWDATNRSGDLLYQGLFLGYTMAVLYAIAQDLVTAEVNLLYVLLPLPLIYWFARIRSVDLGATPASSGPSPGSGDMTNHHAHSPANTPFRRAAFLVVPHPGGTYTVFVNLRIALKPLGISLDWIGDSDHPDALRQDPAYSPELARGTLIDARNKSPAQICAEIVAAVIAGNYDLVFINVLTGPPQMSVAAYLPPRIRRVMIVHNITPGTYSAAKVIGPYCHATVGVSPRIRDDLLQKFNFPKQSTFSVPNAIDLSPYNIPRTPREKTLRLLSVGRIVDPDKGVFWLPKILDQLADLDLHLTIGGDGPDLAELKRRCAHLTPRVTFLGRVPPQNIPALFAKHDILLMPSRFEGFGYTLIEAMAAGCVPIASHITGITDFIVKTNDTGLLFPIGDTQAAANAIRQLATAPDLLKKLSLAGPPNVQARFSTASLTQNYQPVLKELESPRQLPKILHGQPCEPLHIGGGWRRYIPRPLKNFLRTKMYR